MVRTRHTCGFLAVVGACIVSGCSAASLSAEGAKVAASRNPAPPGCAPAGYIIGKGGGTFGGAYISNESLIGYAMNDLRNKAAALGANYVQQDPPELGEGRGTTTSVTITGTAYRCPAALAAQPQTTAAK
jgi:hypothetical protein